MIHITRFGSPTSITPRPPSRGEISKARSRRNAFFPGRRNSLSISWKRPFPIEMGCQGRAIAHRKTGVFATPYGAPPPAVETLDSPFNRNFRQEIDGEWRRPLRFEPAGGAGRGGRGPADGIISRQNRKSGAESVSGSIRRRRRRGEPGADALDRAVLLGGPMLDHRLLRIGG